MRSGTYVNIRLIRKYSELYENNFELHEIRFTSKGIPNFFEFQATEVKIVLIRHPSLTLYSPIDSDLRSIKTSLPIVE